MKTTYRADRVFTGEAVFAPGFVTVDDAYIVDVGTGTGAAGRVVDLGRHDLLPGLVDLHSDCWFQRANPRPTTSFPLDDTLVVLDSEIISGGITTHFVCVSLQNDVSKGRTVELAERSAGLVDELRGELRADHRVHLRVEATSERVELVEDLARLPAVSLLSYMDHTPGQGQFRDERDWRAYYASTGEDNLDTLLASRRARQPYTDAIREELARVAAKHELALASHDDDSPERVDQAHRLGATISEFPVTAAAAAAAAASGLLTVMGAPNALRGTSHVPGNLSARQAFDAGSLGALASDYHPPSLLPAVYLIAAHGACELKDAVSLVTSRPAAAVGLVDRGTLTPGKRADLIAVRLRAGRPVIAQTWIAGRPAFGDWDS